MKKFLIILLLSLLTLSQALAADLKSLTTLFKQNYDNFYQPRYCGRNTARLVSEAHKRKIDLSNSYVLKIVGGGFWETSGFYTRNNINERAMLGYFHMVFVADGYVFDFDLDEPLVLKMDDYFRLQFTPPYPFNFYGGEARTKSELKGWTLTRYEWPDYIKNIEKPTWVKKLRDIMNVDKMVEKNPVK
jgi:opacity protein-like surface antigen